MTSDPQHPKEDASSFTGSSFTGSGAGRLLRDDARFALGRITAFQYVVVAIFALLLIGFWILQVRDHDANSELAERNRVKTVPLQAPRGKILDRDGRVIVDNHSSFTVMLTQENLKLEHLRPIAQGLGLDLDELRATVAKFAKGPKYIPIPIKTELTGAELSFVESHRDPDSFPEMEIVEAQRRLYPRDGMGAHMLGYVGQVTEAQLNQAEFAKYSQGDTVGQFGLERQYNDVLIGIDGQRRAVVDVTGREREVLESKQAIPGKSLQLTIDLDLQAVAELALEGKRGSVVALDPRTGEVLAMVSRPAFDPNVFGRLRKADWDAVILNPDKPMLNRAIQGTYAPGSTFKPIVAIAGLESGAFDATSTTNCNGAANWYGQTFHCHSRHGATDLHKGIVQSCDVYFYNAGNKIGIDRLAEYALVGGVGEKTGIDLPGEEKGLMPSTKWKLQTQRDRWYPSETMSVAIGQGAVEMTPLQLAFSIGGLAMGGLWYQPHLVKPAAQPEPKSRAAWNPVNVETVVAGMYGVVNEGGTGTAAAIPGITVSGKTGSAQRVSNKLVKENRALADTMLDNGWFVGFAPRDNPEIVVVVLVEAGLHGGSASAPIAREVLKTYFDKKTQSARKNPADLAVLLRPLLNPALH
ncbi:MAG: penicillin-binding protein 2 [Acidobacteriota bacterium]